MSDSTYISYEHAFNDMKNSTVLNQPFKMVFIKENGSKKVVAKALIRKQTPTSNDEYGAYKFNYIDVVNDTMGSAYIPSLVSINDKEIRIK